MERDPPSLEWFNPNGLHFAPRGVPFLRADQRVGDVGMPRLEQRIDSQRRAVEVNRASGIEIENLIADLMEPFAVRRIELDGTPQKAPRGREPRAPPPFREVPPGGGGGGVGPPIGGPPRAAAASPRRFA